MGVEDFGFIENFGIGECYAKMLRRWRDGALPSISCCCFLCSFPKDLYRHALPSFAKLREPRTHTEPLIPIPHSFLNRRSEVMANLRLAFIAAKGCSRILSGAPFG